MKRTTTLILCIWLVMGFVLTVFAYSDVKITSNGQIVDTFCNVNAIYATASYGNVDTDSTYCCAAYVKKFYNTV